MGVHKLVPGDNMNKKQWKTYAFWILLSEGVGALAAWLTRDSVEIYSTQDRAAAPVTAHNCISSGVGHTLCPDGIWCGSGQSDSAI